MSEAQRLGQTRPRCQPVAERRVVVSFRTRAFDLGHNVLSCMVGTSPNSLSPFGGPTRGSRHRGPRARCWQLPMCALLRASSRECQRWLLLELEYTSPGQVTAIVDTLADQKSTRLNPPHLGI